MFSFTHVSDAKRMATMVVVGAALTTTLFAIQAPSTAKADPPPLSGYGQPTFDDEFNGTSVDLSAWTPRTGVNVDQDGTKSTQLASSLSESGGALHIALNDSPSVGNTGGGVISNQQFGYGYYETRAKINTGPGWHSAFWSMCVDPASMNVSCQQTEIDGFEIDSNDLTQLQNNIFDWTLPSGSQSYTRYSTEKYSPTNLDASAGWHTYGYDYDAGGVRFYTDGVLTKTLSYPASAHKENLMNIWFSTLALSYSGHGTTDPAMLPATVDVDYIRYYAPPAGTVTVNADLTSGNYHETGAWSASGISGWNGTASRWAYPGKGTAQWNATVPTTGTYDVAAWIPESTSNTTAATYTVTHDGTSTSTTVDTSGPHSRWIDLGSFAMTAGQPETVSLQGAGTGILRTNTVRLILTT
ncbi:golvesin C-terminal-like domain-containing protein [Subtercola lobariae]|uniref:GH16 domain-containing protein n=1 Tax=Subtercola lobariae TaxID=1588641 RepID=A0A917F4H7_9MICO|nr:family 16 glycosylhydrolase [Subtercola lobariae]GGF41939.1 hypothetical protein GCM10011399_38240 [Subtercola lobariae]